MVCFVEDGAGSNVRASATHCVGPGPQLGGPIITGGITSLPLGPMVSSGLEARVQVIAGRRGMRGYIAVATAVRKTGKVATCSIAMLSGPPS